MRSAAPAVVLAALLAAGVAGASTLEVSIIAVGGGSSVTVPPGGTVAYQVVAELDDGATDGLAAVVLDLELAGGALSPAVLPAGPMTAFAPPEGYTPNPAGYGGAPAGDRLRQVGGSQNLFGHGAWSCDDDGDCPGGATCDGGTCAPLPGLPTGQVVAGVALPGAPVVVAEGVATAPSASGTFLLRVEDVRATALAAGATGNPTWATEPLGAVTVPLEVVVSDGVPAGEAIPVVSPAGALLLGVLLALVGVLLLRRR